MRESSGIRIYLSNFSEQSLLSIEALSTVLTGITQIRDQTVGWRPAVIALRFERKWIQMVPK